MSEANPYLIDRLLAVQDEVLKAHAQLDPKAPGHVADLRQVLIQHFLQPLFSAHRRFTSGRITDATGVLTEQLELIVEDGYMPSFPLHDGTHRLVLAEAVALVIEVADQPGEGDARLREVFSHIRQLSRNINPTIKYQGAPSERVPVMAVFFQGPEELEDLQRWWMDIPEAERPDAVCVVFRLLFGFWAGSRWCAGLVLGVFDDQPHAHAAQFFRPRPGRLRRSVIIRWPGWTVGPTQPGSTSPS
jgi:hypothetical protein